MPAKNTVNQGKKLIYLQQFLEERTNEEHVVSISELNEFMKSKGFNEMDRKTYYNLFKILREDCQLEIVYDKQNHGYRLENPKLKPSQIKDIIDCIQSAKFVSQDDANYYAEVLLKLTDKYTRDDLKNRKTLINGRISNSSKSPLRYADSIYAAIARNCNVAFNYAFYAPKASAGEVFSTFKKNIVRYEASPMALYWEDGRIYLHAFVKDRDGFRSFRLDRMQDIEILPHNQRDGVYDFREKQKPTTRKGVVFGMYSAEEPTTVKIRFVNTEANQVVDRFGEKVRMIVVDKSHFEITETVELSPPFYAWLSTFGNKAFITFPPKAQEGMQRFLGKTADLYTYEKEK